MGISSFKTTSPIFPLCLQHIKWRISKADKALFMMEREVTKVVCSREIYFLIRGRSRLENFGNDFVEDIARRDRVEVLMVSRLEDEVG